MNNRIKMSEGLLDLIVMVQNYSKFLINEMIFKETHNLPYEKDWPTKTKIYFNSIDDAILNKYGLCKNKMSYDAVTRFEVTKEMLSTSRDELNKFECWMSCIPE